MPSRNEEEIVAALKAGRWDMLQSTPVPNRNEEEIVAALTAGRWDTLPATPSRNEEEIAGCMLILKMGMRDTARVARSSSALKGEMRIGRMRSVPSQWL